MGTSMILVVALNFTSLTFLVGMIMMCADDGVPMGIAIYSNSVHTDVFGLPSGNAITVSNRMHTAYGPLHGPRLYYSIMSFLDDWPMSRDCILMGHFSDLDS